MNLTYEKCGDYLIPNLIPDPEPEESLTKYGLMRRNYLKEHRRGVYSGLLMTGKLKAHCLGIQRQAEERMDFLTEQMAKTEGVDEMLKASDQMKWVYKILTFGFFLKSKLLRNPNFQRGQALNQGLPAEKVWISLY